ncbi:MAG: hypothetical protein MMC23_001156 [Stictis urceolatum]|nr:hypothetical protein [Stictis urceolata]
MDDQQALAELSQAVATWYGVLSTSDSVRVSSGGENQHNEGRFRLDPKLLRKLLNGLYYSRYLIATYYATIGIFLLLLTIRYWIPRFRRSRTSDSFETKVLLEQSPPSYGSDDASSPSALKSHDISRTSMFAPRLTILWSIKSKCHAWLLYQPKPIPIVNKALPPNETSLAVLILIGINIFYTLFKIEFDIKLIFVFASRCGLLFVANLPLLYILAAKNQPIKFLTGHSYESLNIYHRRLGEYMCLLGILHSIGMLFVYLSLRKGDFTWTEFLTSKVIMLGLGGLICYETLYITSLANFRQAWYELFLALHIFLQTGALAFVFFHHSESRLYVGLALGIFCIDRLLFRYILKTNTLQATTTIHPDKQTVSLTVSYAIPTRNRRLRQIVRGVRGSWQSAEHVFLSVPTLGKSGWLQAHPFTIASAAPHQQSSTADLELIIRAQDGFSRKILHHAQLNPAFKVRIDGPYGTSSALDMLRDSDVSMLVAGGSGIAVVWPLICTLLAEQDDAASHADNGPQKKRSRQIVLIWVVRESEHTQWIVQEALDDTKARGVEVIIPIPTESGGRPDLDLILSTCIEARGGNKKIRTICSGPDGLNRTVQNACSELVGMGMDVEIEVHKYGW